MKTFYLSIGSNSNAIENINAALLLLAESFGDICVSNTYKNAAVGDGVSDYHNLSAGFDSALKHSELVAQLKVIENKLSRDRSLRRTKGVTIDLDIVLCVAAHGEEVYYYDKDIVHYSFILAPLAEIAGAVYDPALNKSYHALWQEFDKHAHPLYLVDINH